MEHPTTDEPIELKTKPERVIIFQEGAQVTRSGKKRLDSGAITVKIGGIPAAVDTQSIRVKGTGPGQILNMVVKRAYAQNEQPGRARDIIDQVKALTKEQRGIDDAIATKETALAQFKQSLAGSTGKFALFSATGKSTFTTYGELEVTLSGKIEASIDEISGLQKSKKDVVKRIAILQKEFEKLRARQGTVESTEIFLDLEVKKAGEFDFVISYVFKSSSQARWQPFYEINLHEEAEDASLKMNGLVTNKTGEDWLDITLALSTA
nr:mucoidy inhibitor MuiA family protein [Candidatus Sigynarchaeota archaeon]